MTFAIAKHNAIKGIADFVDEAQEFAERFAGMQGEVVWTTTGQMITLDGEPTGYRLLVMNP